MGTNRNRHTETVIYTVLWIIAISLYLLDIMRNRAQLSQPLLTIDVVQRVVETMLPFLVLFLINNSILIPKLLLKNRLRPYFLLTVLVVIILWGYQYLSFIHEIELRPHFIHPAPNPHVRPLLPMPLFLDCIYALLVVGCNLAIALMFQRFDDKLERESLMKANAESQLAYLKAQINPHFYMNMLNNIHGMIEIDAEKAQSMVIDMSHLMRYMLYDSSKPLISLADEVAFLRNYLRLMRQRFPENKVVITTHFPSEEAMRGISIPPLLGLVFVENAFKHGISYREPSFVGVSFEIQSDTTLHFSCVNSNHAKNKNTAEHTGIGLKNVSQRLSLLYGQTATLDLNDTPETYTVNLTIPSHHDTKNSDN